MASCRRFPSLIRPAALAALLPGPAALAGFQLEAEPRLIPCPIHHPIGIDVRSDERIILWTRGEPALGSPARIIDSRARRTEGGELAWDSQPLPWVPADVAGMAPVAPDCVFLRTVRQTFHYQPMGNLAQTRRQWAFNANEGRFRAKGGGTLCSWAATPRGSLVLGFERGVLLVEPPGEDPDRAPAARFLWCKSAPAEEKGLAAGSPSSGLLVAVDGEGRVLMLDRETRQVRRFTLGPLKGELLGAVPDWPCQGFQPEYLQAFGDTLLVGGRPTADDPAWTLVALAPGASGAFEARLLGIRASRGARFAFTPSGHLVLADPQERHARIYLNTLAARLPGQENKGASAAPGAAAGSRAADPEDGAAAKADRALEEPRAEEPQEARKLTRKEKKQRRRAERA
jgi:hypothetical protein